MKKPKRVTDAQLQTIKQLSNEGVSGNQIAKRLGISPSVARYHMKRLDVTKSPDDSKVLSAFNSYKLEMDKLKKKFVEVLIDSLH